MRRPRRKVDWTLVTIYSLIIACDLGLWWLIIRLIRLWGIPGPVPIAFVGITVLVLALPAVAPKRFTL